MLTVRLERRVSLALLVAVALCASSIAAQGALPPLKVVDRLWIDTTARACTDFFQFANGGWIAHDTIPAAYSSSGVARDSFSPISELAYSVDGGDWQPFSPRDGIFDDPVEEFRVTLPPGLQPGTHSLAVRAVDAADNVGAAQISFRVGEPPSPRRR